MESNFPLHVLELLNNFWQAFFSDATHQKKILDDNKMSPLQLIMLTIHFALSLFLNVSKLDYKRRCSSISRSEKGKISGSSDLVFNLLICNVLRSGLCFDPVYRKSSYNSML